MEHRQGNPSKQVKQSSSSSSSSSWSLENGERRARRALEQQPPGYIMHIHHINDHRDQLIMIANDREMMMNDDDDVVSRVDRGCNKMQMQMQMQKAKPKRNVDPERSKSPQQ